jgi:hypothetical protein
LRSSLAASTPWTSFPGEKPAWFGPANPSDSGHRRTCVISRTVSCWRDWRRRLRGGIPPGRGHRPG